MGINIFPAASAASKTAYRTTLTSGTSFTVPAGVNYMNVTLVGGGGGGALSSGNTNRSDGGSGGTTTFTGATSASGGTGGGSGNFANTGNGNVMAAGANGTDNLGAPGAGSIMLSNSFQEVFSMNPGIVAGLHFTAQPGKIVTSTLNTTPGATINYSIGAGGNRPTATSNNGTTYYGAFGGSGRIDIEYWL